MASSRLLERTIHLVRNRSVTITHKMIADTCGVSERWIEELSAGRIDNPSVVKVECVYEYLTGKPLTIEA